MLFTEYGQDAFDQLEEIFKVKIMLNETEID